MNLCIFHRINFLSRISKHETKPIRYSIIKFRKMKKKTNPKSTLILESTVYVDVDKHDLMKTFSSFDGNSKKVPYFSSSATGKQNQFPAPIQSSSMASRTSVGMLPMWPAFGFPCMMVFLLA